MSQDDEISLAEHLADVAGAALHNLQKGALRLVGNPQAAKELDELVKPEQKEIEQIKKEAESVAAVSLDPVVKAEAKVVAAEAAKAQVVVQEVKAEAGAAAAAGQSPLAAFGKCRKALPCTGRNVPFRTRGGQMCCRKKRSKASYRRKSRCGSKRSNRKRASKRRRSRK